MAKKYDIDEETRKKLQDLLGTSVSGIGTQYDPVFSRAYQDIFQPGNITREKPLEYGLGGKNYDYERLNADYGRGQVADAGVQSLANTFIDSFYQKFGKLPNQDQVESFVGDSLTPSFASKFIQGYPGQQIKSQVVDPYLEAYSGSLGEDVGIESEDFGSTLQKELDRLYGQARENVLSNINEQYGKQRGQLIEEEAALGRLRSPASIATVSEIDKGKQKAQADALARLAESQATGQLGVSSHIADINQRAKEFGQNLALQRRQLDEDAYQSSIDRLFRNKELDISKQLGLQQAEASKPGALDYANLGIGALGALATPFTFGGSSLAGGALAGTSILSLLTNLFRKRNSGTAGVGGKTSKY